MVRYYQFYNFYGNIIAWITPNFLNVKESVT